MDRTHQLIERHSSETGAASAPPERWPLAQLQAGLGLLALRGLESQARVSPGSIPSSGVNRILAQSPAYQSPFFHANGFGNIPVAEPGGAKWVFAVPKTKPCGQDYVFAPLKLLSNIKKKTCFIILL